jgi:hypothetical protein
MLCTDQGLNRALALSTTFSEDLASSGVKRMVSDDRSNPPRAETASGDPGHVLHYPYIGN